MKHKRNIILLVLATLLLVILVTLILFKTPRFVNVEDISFENNTEDSLFLNCKIQLVNSNWIDLKCNSLQFISTYNDSKFAEGKIQEPILLKSNELTELPILFKADKSQISNGVKDFFLNDSLRILLKAEGKCTWANIPFNLEKEFTISSKEFLQLFKKNILNLGTEMIPALPDIIQLQKEPNL